MTVVLRRAMGALAGFINRHGTWPTKLLVPVQNWTEFREAPGGDVFWRRDELALATLNHVELVPVPLPKYIAIDNDGHWFDYDEGVVSNSHDAVERSLQSTFGVKTRSTQPTRPIPDSYVVPGTRLVAGEYPGSKSEVEARAKVQRFLDAGITAFVDLTDPADGLSPYDDILRDLGRRRGIDVCWDHLSITDMDVCGSEQMRLILDTIDAHLAAERNVYVHCWGGVGRTGTVVGCWLVRHGMIGNEALAEVKRLFGTMSPEQVHAHRATGSPQTKDQRRMVRHWGAEDPSALRPIAGVLLRDRVVGSMLGLAVGDALGTTLEFKRPGTFEPIQDMIGGGPFHLKPGEWTDDTSMALCLAESLIECVGFDPADQMRRYVRWVDAGHWSSTGRCFDIGNTVRGALGKFRTTAEPYSGSKDENTAGNGSLMRLAPVPLFFARDPARAIRMAADSSRTTHGTPAAVDACRYFAGLILGALHGVSKEELLSRRFAPVPGLWEREPLHPAVAAIADGSFRAKAPPAIRGTGYVIDSLEAALWAFATNDDFASGALAAVNLGDDADTTGAVYGQLAGAFYGADAIPSHWRERVSKAGEIVGMAERLLAASGRQI